MKTSANIFVSLLRELGVPHTRRFATSLYEEHPYKNTLYGLTKLLSLYGVANKAFRIADKQNVFQFEVPFLVGFSRDFAIVTDILDDGKVRCNWLNKPHIYDNQDFLKNFSGVVLIATPNETSGEPNYQQHKRDGLMLVVERALVFISCFVTVAYLCVLKNHHYGLNDLMILATNLIGLLVSSLLVFRQVDIYSDIGNRLCGMNGKNNCDLIVKSPYAKLFGVFSWSEIGLSYFTCNILLGLVAPQWTAYMTLLAYGACCFAVWSIWFQWKKAKTWCALCLVVQVVFALQACIYLIAGYHPFSSEYFGYGILPFAGSYIITFSIYRLVLRVVEVVRENNSLKYSLNHLKAQDCVLHALQNELKFYPTENATALVFGNPEASNVITVMSNPFCRPCAEMHGHLKELQKMDCRIEYVTSFFNSDLSQVNKLFIAAYFNQGKDFAWDLLCEWYESDDFHRKDYLSQFKFDVKAKNVIEELGRHVNWQNQNNIHETPFILFNGYQLVEPYRIEDISLFL